MDFDENQKFSMKWPWPMTFYKMAASMPTNEIWAYVEMVPICNFAHRTRSSQINMLCVTNKYRLCEFHLNALTLLLFSAWVGVVQSDIPCSKKCFSPCLMKWKSSIVPKSTVGRCATSICKHFKWNDSWFLTCEKWIYCGYALLVIHASWII